MTPSAPAAIAAMVRGSTMKRMPAAWLGSTITGRCVLDFSMGMADISRVFLIEVSKVRIPLSQRITCSFPPAMIYSALISSSSRVFAIPLFRRMGLRIFPSSLRSSKFCIFLVPTWITSTSSKRGRCSALMISVTMGSPVAFWASTSIFRPSLPSPWKEYGEVLGLKAPPLNNPAPAF